MKKNRILCLLLLLAGLPAMARLELPYIFSSHMVLQRNVPVRIWGKANPGETVSVSFHHQKKTTTAGANGHWNLFLSKENAGGPYLLSVTTKTDSVRLTDVLVGEVWVCSGQSNMEWNLASAKNAKEEMAAANLPAIRQFDVPNRVAFAPQANTAQTEWVVCRPETAGNFSAVAYFFARKLHKELGVPIGLVNSTWGGIAAEAWTSRASLQQHPDFAKAVQETPASETAYAARRMKKFADLINRFQGKSNSSNEEGWKRVDFNDNTWPKLSVDRLWEEQSLPGFDGTVCYRTELILANEQVAQHATLALGTIDDDDSTFFNGQLIGTTHQWNAERVYRIDKSFLKAGRNVLLVKARDNGQGGGFYGKAERALTFSDGQKIALPTAWRAQVSTSSGATSNNPNEILSSLYNGMLHPLTNYTIRGVIWYQGESNADRARQYETLFPLLITDWRNAWKQGDLPFYFVQLSSYDPQHKAAGSESRWAELREAQRKTLSLPNTGMAVTYDIGETDDIHPKNKQDVGLRLAMIALNKTYKKPLLAAGPRISTVKKTAASLVLSFDQTGTGLQTRKTDEVIGFDVVDKKGTVHILKGKIVGSTVVLPFPSAIIPVQLRYAWRDDAGDASLFNREGWPAEPFSKNLATEIEKHPTDNTTRKHGANKKI